MSNTPPYRQALDQRVAETEHIGIMRSDDGWEAFCNYCAYYSTPQRYRAQARHLLNRHEAGSKHNRLVKLKGR